MCEKKIKYKRENKQNIQKFNEKAEILSIKNKFIGTLTHEIRNCVTKYYNSEYSIVL